MERGMNFSMWKRWVTTTIFLSVIFWVIPIALSIDNGCRLIEFCLVVYGIIFWVLVGLLFFLVV